MSSQYDRRLYQLVGAFYRRFDYPKGMWRAFRVGLALLKGRRLTVPATNQKFQNGELLFIINAKTVKAENIKSLIAMQSTPYVAILENGSIDEAQAGVIISIMEAEGLAACWLPAVKSAAAIGSFWRTHYLKRAVEDKDLLVAARRIWQVNLKVKQPSSALAKCFEPLSQVLTKSDAEYVPAPATNPFLNRIFHQKLSPMPRVTVVAPWFDHAGSSVLTADIFSHDIFKDFVFTSVAYKDHDPRHNTEEGLKTFNSFSSDSENLGLFQPLDRRADLLFELMGYWKSEILFNANCADIYRNLKAIKAQFPNVKVVDHLFNTSWHFDLAIKNQHYIDLFIVANDLVRNALVAGGVADAKVKVIYHGINPELFKPVDATRTTERAFTAGFVGRLSDEKRPFDFLEAISCMPDVRAVLFGEGALKAELVDEIKRLRLTDRVEVTFRPRGRAMYEEIDVLVVTSEFEGLPMVVLEALAMGLPVVATPVGAIPRVLYSERIGRLFPIGDIAELVSALENIRINLKSERSSAADRRLLIETEYSLDRCAASYRRAFDEVSKS